MANDILSILLAAGIDTNASKLTIQKQLDELAKTTKFNIQLDIVNGLKEVDKVKQKLKKITQTKGSVFINSQVENQAFDSITARIRDVKQNVDKLAKVDITEGATGGIQKAIITYKNEVGQVVKETMAWVETQKKVNGELTKLKTFKTTKFDISDASDLTKEINLYQQLLEKVKEQGNLETKIIVSKQEKASLTEKEYQRQLQVNLAEQKQLQQEIQQGDYNNAELENKISEQRIDNHNKINLANARAKDGIDATRTSLGSFWKEMKIALVRTIEWGVAMGSIYGTLRKIREGIEYLKELDKNLTNVRIVTGATADEMSKLASNYTALAKEMGATTNELLGGAVEWFRQGKSMEEAQELVKASIIESKLAAIDSAQATEYLTSVLNGYKIESKNVMTVIDQMVAVDNAAATSVAELSEALKRSSNSAAQSGVEFSRLIGYVGTISSVTRKSAESIGESMKTMFARMSDLQAGKLDEEGMSLSNVESALNRVNIALRKDAVTFRDFDNVLDDLAATWNTLNDVEQSNIAKSIAGIRQRENFLVLMNNYNKALELEKIALNSNGLALERYGIYLESVEAKQKQLASAWESFWNNTMNSKTIKGFYDTLTAIVSTFDKFGAGIPIIAGLISGALTAAIIALNGGIEKLNWALIKTNLLSGGIPILVGAITTGITMLGFALSKTNKETETFAETQQDILDSANENTGAFKDNVSELTKLKDKYIELNSATDKSETIKSQLTTVENNLKKALENTNTQLDLQNGKLEDNITLINEQIKKKAEQYVIENKAAYEAAKKFAKGTDKDTVLRGNLENILPDTFEGTTEQWMVLYGKFEGTIEERIKALYNVRDEFLKKYEKYWYRDYYADIAKYAESEAKAFQKQLDDNISFMTEYENALKIKAGDLTSIVVDDDSDEYIPEGSITDKETLKKLLDANKISLKQYYDGLLAIRKELYSDYIGKSTGEIQSLLKLGDKKASDFLELEAELFNVKNNLNKDDPLGGGTDKDPYRATIDTLTTYQQKLDDISTALQRNKILIDQTEGQDRIDNLKQRIALLEQQKQALHDINNANDQLIQSSLSDIEKMYGELGTFDPSSNQMIWEVGEDGLLKWQTVLKSLTDDDAKNLESTIKDIYDRVKDNVSGSTEWLNVNKEQIDLNKEILDIQEAQLEILEKQAEQTRKNQIESQKQLLEKYKQQEEALKNIIDLTTNLIKQEYQDIIDKLEDQLDAHKEITDEIKKQIKLQEANDDYRKDEKKKQDEILKLQRQITQLSRDDSRQAQAEKLKLEEDLAKKQEDLSEFRHDRDIELQLEALDEGQKAFEDKQKEEIDKYKQKLSEAGTLQQEAITRINDALATGSDTLYGSLISWNQKYGSSIQDDIVSAWKNAKDAMLDYQSSSGGLNIEGAMTKTREAQIIAQMQQNSISWHGATSEERIRLHEENIRLAKQLSGSVEFLKGKWWQNGIPIYGKGAYVDTPRLSVVGDRPEFIIPKENIMDFVNKVNMMNIPVPKMPNFNPLQNSNALKIDSLITINGNADRTILPDLERIANTVVDKINNGFYKVGKMKPIRTLG